VLFLSWMDSVTVICYRFPYDIVSWNVINLLLLCCSIVWILVLCLLLYGLRRCMVFRLHYWSVFCLHELLFVPLYRNGIRNKEFRFYGLVHFVFWSGPFLSNFSIIFSVLFHMRPQYLYFLWKHCFNSASSLFLNYTSLSLLAMDITLR
jgi:hypothetical protein